MNQTIPKVGERVEKASQFVYTCKTLLDVGCGDGIIHHFIKDKVDKIYGIDSDIFLLKRAKKRGIITNKINLDKEIFPYRSNFFDIITCLDVIEHVYDPRLLLSEIYRVLKKGGTCIISTPNIRFSDHIVTLLLKGTFPKTSLDPDLYDGGHIHFFTYKDMHQLLNHAGFADIVDEGIINKEERGWKGKIVQFLIGDRLMLEFRTPGILLITKK